MSVLIPLELLPEKLRPWADTASASTLALALEAGHGSFDEEAMDLGAPGRAVSLAAVLSAAKLNCGGRFSQVLATEIATKLTQSAKNDYCWMLHARCAIHIDTGFELLFYARDETCAFVHFERLRVEGGPTPKPFPGPLGERWGFMLTPETREAAFRTIAARVAARRSSS